MKKTSMSLYCLLLFSVTGFSQQKDNKPVTGLSSPVCKKEASLNFNQRCERVVNLSADQALFNTGLAPGKYDYNRLCFPKRIFNENIIQQLFNAEK